MREGGHFLNHMQKNASKSAIFYGFFEVFRIFFQDFQDFRPVILKNKICCMLVFSIETHRNVRDDPKIPIPNSFEVENLEKNTKNP